MSTSQLLTEGITDLEDLDITAFIDAVRRIGQMQASEKLDGSGLWFGLDEAGKFYTCRPGKRDGTERFYSESDYPYFAANNGLRAAHAALQYKQRDIAIALQPGDIVEAQVLYGRQPNAVSYGLDGKNFIAILRGIAPTTDSKADNLAGMLDNHEVIVKPIIVDTPDGINLERKTVTQTFRFVGLQKIDSSVLKSVNLEKELKKLEKYLDEKSGILELSNFELMTTSLGSIPKEERVGAKAAKEAVIAKVRTDYKLTIKKQLLDKFISKVKPALSAADLSGDEDVGLDGIVLRDPESGEQLKVVDKDSFSTINQFNFAVRNQIAGSVRTLDDTAPLEARGGITGQMKIRIATLLGNPDLAMGRLAKKIFADNIGDSPPQTLKNVAKILNGAQDFNGTKNKIEAVVSATIDELSSMLEKFNKHKDSTDQTYSLKLKSGKKIGLSPEVLKRTLMTFAETRRNLSELRDKVKSTKNFDQLIAVLYGRAARQAHAADVDVIEESFNAAVIEEAISTLFEARTFANVDRYKESPSAAHLLQTYLATLFMSVVILKADDARGQRLLKDKTNYRLTKYSDVMAPLNFWGFAVWNADKANVAKLLQPGVAAGINRITKKIPAQWVKNLHMDLSHAGDMKIEWEDHYKTVRQLLQQADGINGTERVISILEDVFQYETLSFDQKTKLLPKVYFYGTQYVPSSPLITRIRFIQNNLLGNGYDALDDVTPPSTVVFSPGAGVNTLLGEVAKLLDEEEVPGAEAGYSQPAPPSPTSTATTTKDIASSPKKIDLKKYQTVKRKRNPDIKFKKFERPTKEEEQ